MAYKQKPSLIWLKFGNAEIIFKDFIRVDLQPKTLPHYCGDRPIVSALSSHTHWIKSNESSQIYQASSQITTALPPSTWPFILF